MTIKKYFDNDFMIVKYVFLIYELYNKFGLIKFPEAKIEKKNTKLSILSIMELLWKLFSI